MKRLFFFLLLLSVMHASSAQQQAPKEFEGYIEFAHHIASPDGKVNVDKAKEIFGTSSILYYKDGFYKWVFDDGGVKYEIFNPVKNTVFTYHTEAPPIEDLATSDYKVVEDSFLLQREMVAGLLCQKYYIETTYPSGQSWKRVFSYSSEVPLLPAHFSKCSTNAFDYIYPKLKCLPLKIEITTPGPLQVIYEATRVVHQPIDPAIFKYP
jgi:hypothetical protein